MNQNYRETLDAAALAYLQRHQAKHLGDVQQLFNLCVAHLMAFLDAEKAMAENTVARVMGQLQAAGERRYLDVSACTSGTIVIADPVTGISHIVPVHLICQLLLDNPERQRR